MDKRRLHHTWTKIRWLKPWYFLVLALIATTVCVLALRANNERMISLRSAVYTADKNDGDVAGTLSSLQSYVTSHMNTSLDTGQGTVYPPIQLKYTYERLQAKAQATESSNQLYTEAQHYCEKQDSVDFSGHNRVPCIERYVQSHGGAKPTTIPDALYKFAFVSPSWSPDLAGWSLLAAVILWLLFFAALIVSFWFKRYTK